MSANPWAEANDRSLDNRRSATNEPLRAGADLLSVKAEQAFCAAVGLDWAAVKPMGRTLGYQFDCGGTRVKVFATTPGRNLLVKQGKAKADVFVLVWVEGERAWIAGWCERALVLAIAPRVPKHDGPYRVACHLVARALLDRDVEALKRRLGLAAPEPAQLSLFGGPA